MGRLQVVKGIKQPRLVILSAPSGAGKSTLCEKLVKEFAHFKLSISATTRPARANEKEGVHYFFLKRSEFEERIQRGEFVEHAVVHDALYGTLRSTVESALRAGQHVVFDIDVQGAMSLLKQYPERALLIFINPPSMKELEGRLRARKTESSTSIERRLENAYNELEWRKHFDYQIVNDELNRAYQELKQILQRECP